MSSGKKPIRVLLAVPSFRGTVMVHTMASLVRAVGLFGELGIQSELINVDSAEIVVVRNAMATYALNRPEITHLLFVDDDMSFEADAVLDLLRSNKPVVGCICPKREVSFERFHAAAREGADVNEAMAQALSFVTRHLTHQKVEVKEGLMQVAGIGMGVTLIRREVLERMVASGILEKRRPHNGGDRDSLGNEFVWNFFETLYSEDSGTMLSEDLSFCERWTRQCEGEIWATVDRKIGHIGPFMFAGSYLDLLRQGKG